MKRIATLILGLLLILPAALAQSTTPTTAAINGYCTQGGVSALTQGLSSVNTLQGIIPSCTVTVYVTGTLTPATLSSDAAGTPLSNPFTASDARSASPGQWVFYASTSQSYDIEMTGGIPPNVFKNPVSLVDVAAGGGGGGGGSGGQTLFNVLAYGAKCDGSTDDSAALAATAAAALTGQGTIYIAPGSVCKESLTWNILANIQANGALIETTADAPAIQVGSQTSYTGPPITYSRLFWLPDTLNLNKPTTGWNGTANVGVKIENVNSSEIHEGHNKGFLTGTWFASINGLGSAYNKVFVGEEEDNFIDYKVLAEDNSGYITQNTFMGGRLEMNGAESPHANVTGIFTAGSAVVTGVSPSTTGITAGMTVLVSPKVQPNVSAPMPSVPYATTVASVNSVSQITLSAPSNISTDTLVQAPVTGITLPSPNSGFSGSCSVTISAPTTTGGVTATATCAVSGGGALSFTITNGGSLYSVPAIATVVVTGVPTSSACYPNLCLGTTIGNAFIYQPNTIIFPVQGSRGLLIAHQPAGFNANGNTFTGTSWEGDAMEYPVELAGATDNIFENGRFESSVPRLKLTSVAGYTTEYNHFIGGFGGLYLTQVMDDVFTGANDLEAPGYQFKVSGGGDRGAVMYSSQSSASDPLIVFMPPGNGINVTTFNQNLTTGWNMQFSPNYIQAKTTSDVWPRMRFSTSNGSFSFGDGTFDLSGQNGTAVPNTLGYINGTSGKDLGVLNNWWIANDGWNAGHFVFFDATYGARHMWLDAQNHFRVSNGAPTADTSGRPVNIDLYTNTLNIQLSGGNPLDTYSATNATQTYLTDAWTQTNPSYSSSITVFDPVLGIKCYTAAAGTAGGTFNAFWTLQANCPIASSSSSGVTSITGTSSVTGAITFAGAVTQSGNTFNFTGTGTGTTLPFPGIVYATSATGGTVATSAQLVTALNTSPSTTLSASLIPTLNQNTTGNAATASALAATPTPCAGGYAPTGILANGNATGCAQIGTLTGVTAGTGLTGGGTTGVVTVALASALPNGETATTQSVGDSSAKVATDAFVLANAGSAPSFAAITAGTNTTATMTLGSGGILTYSGVGEVNANYALGSPITVSPTLNPNYIPYINSSNQLEADSTSVIYIPPGTGTIASAVLSYATTATPVTFLLNGTYVENTGNGIALPDAGVCINLQGLATSSTIIQETPPTIGINGAWSSTGSAATITQSSGTPVTVGQQYVFSGVTGVSGLAAQPPVTVTSVSGTSLPLTFTFSTTTIASGSGTITAGTGTLAGMIVLGKTGHASTPANCSYKNLTIDGGTAAAFDLDLVSMTNLQLENIVFQNIARGENGAWQIGESSGSYPTTGAETKNLKCSMSGSTYNSTTAPNYCGVIQTSATDGHFTTTEGTNVKELYRVLGGSDVFDGQNHVYGGGIATAGAYVTARAELSGFEFDELTNTGIIFGTGSDGSAISNSFGVYNSAVSGATFASIANAVTNIRVVNNDWSAYTGNSLTTPVVFPGTRGSGVILCANTPDFGSQNNCGSGGTTYPDITDSAGTVGINNATVASATTLNVGTTGTTAAPALVFGNTVLPGEATFNCYHTATYCFNVVDDYQTLFSVQPGKVQLNVALDLNNEYINAGENNVTACTGTQTFYFSSAGNSCKLTGNVTFSTIAAPTSGGYYGQISTLDIIQTTGNSYTVTFPSNIGSIGGTVVTVTAGKSSLYTLQWLTAEGRAVLLSSVLNQ